MSNLREDVARAIRGRVWNHAVLYGDATEDYIDGIDDAADAAIAAVIDRLVKEAEAADTVLVEWTCDIPDWDKPCIGVYLSDVLRTYLPTEGGDDAN